MDDTSAGNKKRLQAALVGLPSEEHLYRLTDFFSAFADSTRIKIISALLTAGELSVGEIARIVGTSESAVSHQPKTLRLLRLIAYRNEGRKVFYHLDDSHIEEILHAGLEHVIEKP